MTEPTLTDFLLARIAEDEAAARQIHARRCETPAAATGIDVMGRDYPMPCDCDWHVGRVLAECQSKRYIVSLATRPVLRFRAGAQEAMQATLRLLAQPYADHPDYRQEWDRRTTP